MDNTAFFDLSCGMFVLGALHDGKPTGCTVSAVMQVDGNPPLLAVSVNHQNFTNACIKQTGRATLSVLEEGTPPEWIRTLGLSSGLESGKLDAAAYTCAPSGLPRLAEHLCAWFDCKVKTSLELSTHTLFILEAEDAGRLEAGAPMTFSGYCRDEEGPVPPNAPQAAPPAAAPAAEPCLCTLCGYEYDGGQGPFEDLPDTWKCPLCGAGRELFQRT